MPTFQYNIAPNPRGGFTSRPVLRKPVSDQTLLEGISAQTGFSPEQVTQVVNATLDAIMKSAAQSDYSMAFLGRLRFTPSCGGSQSRQDDFHTADNLNAGVALTIDPRDITKWRRTLRLESQGLMGKITPEITSVISLEGGQVDAYQPGRLLEVRGNNLRFDRDDPAQGIFFTPAGGTEVRAGVYGPLLPKTVSVLVPTGLTGPLEVRIAAYINGSVRAFIYSMPLTQLP
jgi:hypothetical protein